MLKEVKRKSSPPTITCVVCGISQVQIGGLNDWTMSPHGHVCVKDACRASAGTETFVPPDKRS